jgi:hypothetical protein
VGGKRKKKKKKEKEKKKIPWAAFRVDSFCSKIQSNGLCEKCT